MDYESTHVDESATPAALVAYGSVTGNAQDYAEEVGRMLERLHIQTTVSELDVVNFVRAYTQQRLFFLFCFCALFLF